MFAGDTAHTSSANTCAAPTTANLGTVAPFWDGFTFAKSGNRSKVVSVRKPGSALVSTTHTSTFPDPTADRPHAVTATTKSGGSTGTESFTYDGTGSLSKRSTATTTGKAIEFDREGHQKTVTDLATGKTTEYLYDTEGNRLLERNSADDSVTLFLGSTEMKVKSGVRSTMRTYSMGGEAVATRDTAGLKLMATDHQGTPLLSVNATTQAFDKRRYTPFGELLAAPAAAWPSTRGFLNKTTDSSTGTTHVGAREYDPAGGRFISVDPVLDPMDPQQMNGYAYANNSPVTMSDPDGLRPYCGGGCGGDYNSASAYRHNYNGTSNSRLPGNRSYSEPGSNGAKKKPGMTSAQRSFAKRAAAFVPNWQTYVNPVATFGGHGAEASGAAATMQTRAIAGRYAPRSAGGQYVSHASVPWWSRADPDNWQAKAGGAKNFKLWTNVGKVVGPVGLGFTTYDSGMQQWNGDAGEGYSGFERGARSFGRGAIVTIFSGGAAAAMLIVTSPLMVTGFGTAGTVFATAGAGVVGQKVGTRFADQMFGKAGG